MSIRFIILTYRWLIRRPGYMLMTACDDRLAAEPAERFARAWVGLMLFSLLCGLGLAGLWGLAWKFFPDSDMLLMHSAVTVAAFALWPFRRHVAAMADLLAGRDTTVRATAAAALVLVLALCLMRMDTDPIYQGVLAGWASWLRPDYEFSRVLVLMPVWGGWSMLITCQFRRPGEGTCPAVAALARGCGAVVTAGGMGVIMAVTIVYFNFLPWMQLTIPAATVAAAIIGGLVFCRITGGLSQKALLATNMLTQLVFLMAYLSNRLTAP